MTMLSGVDGVVVVVVVTGGEVVVVGGGGVVVVVVVVGGVVVVVVVVVVVPAPAVVSAGVVVDTLAAVSEMWSNVAVVSADVLWLVTASPAVAVAPIAGMETVPT